VIGLIKIYLWLLKFLGGLGMKQKIELGTLMGISILLAGCSLFGIRTEETPKYEVLNSEGDKEIRSYAKFIIAKTTVKGEFKEAQGEAFRVLAGYIFGDNEKKQNISMTAPVMQEPVRSSEKISMTAPVLQSPTENGWVMAFMMPSAYSLADLPKPKDERISFEEIPAKLVGVVRYSGLGKQNRNLEKANELKTWLEASGKHKIISEPSFAGYDPPWTLPFLRRNEMMYEIEAKTKAEVK
jgi:hypothetical protein